MTTIRGQNHFSEVDPKVPVLTGVGRADFKRFKRSVEAWYLAQIAESDDKKLAALHKGLGPSLYKNLLAADADIAALVEAEDPRTYAVEGGVEALIQLLERNRFAESKLRELPRLFRHFYRGSIRFRPNVGGDEPMRNFIAEMKRARTEMTTADADSAIGDAAFCFWISRKPNRPTSSARVVRNMTSPRSRRC